MGQRQTIAGWGALKLTNGPDIRIAFGSKRAAPPAALTRSYAGMVGEVLAAIGEGLSFAFQMAWALW
jgi:hypothetical protein